MALSDVDREIVVSGWRLYLLMTCSKILCKCFKESGAFVTGFGWIHPFDSFQKVHLIHAAFHAGPREGYSSMRLRHDANPDASESLAASTWMGSRAFLTADIQGCSAREFQTTKIENPKLFQLYQKHIFEIVLCFIMGSTEEPLSGKNPN